MSTKREKLLLNTLRQAMADFTTIANRAEDPKIRELASAYRRTTLDILRQFGPAAVGHGLFPEEAKCASSPNQEDALAKAYPGHEALATARS